MNTQPETYLRHYHSARMRIMKAAIIVAGVLLSTPLRAQESGAKLDPPVQELVTAGKQALAVDRYDDAEKTFKKANKLAHDSCLPC